ncbi:putative F420-dependent oxidoreductase [Kibdelosporangium banguiense]|uniref:F420-dependent oxidoreductase n=1 Tax=Kibdelosporangium banguiense TaxID=1365924 RepID=A0ABS4TU84_9PSEU|nr:TIGR03619 family F420-dependent LLM class oxidoreductase [Kibdelosporangium banguiense]MBP2327506.1 putative F420-dependent oxidoreductase [Kibdelosporangium banguiense]
MRIGFSLPQVGAHAHHYDQLPAYAKAIEELGADSLWVSDRVLAPVNPTVGYAGTDEIPEAFHSVLDPLALVAAVGTVTQRVTIGTNVLIAPWYPPILLARFLTTADIITGGRLITGFGTGWSPEEYASVGVPMKQRGARLEECLDILDAYWTTNPVQHQGEHWTIPPTYVELKPVQRPRPPVYLAAFAPASFARAGRRADGWMPMMVPSADFDPAFLTAGITAIRTEAEKAGRDPDTLDTLLRVNPRPGTTVQNIIDGIELAREKAGINHAYLDVNFYRHHAEALDIAGQVYSAVRG